MHKYLILIILSVSLSCQPEKPTIISKKPFQLVTIDPGHFHAALVQKSMYPDVDSVVYVYAPSGPDVDLHLNRIEAFNSRVDNPTAWNEIVYGGPDFFEKMIREKRGNVVVLSGNNAKKTEYILESLKAGFNVLADKPMVINPDNFQLLLAAFKTADSNGLLLYDIMTERHEITTVLQKELSLIPEIFGTLEKGSPDNPAITKESIHHLFKYVSGSVLTRPPWFLDVSQQGEGVVDVTTHLVDLVQWECFPNEVLDTTNVSVISVRHWTTDLTLSEFSAITKLNNFPDYLEKYVEKDSILKVYSNGEINFKIKDVHAKVSVIWAYNAPEGTGDTHYSIMRGSMANLVIRQDAEENFKPTLYIEPIQGAIDSNILEESFVQIQDKYPGVDLEQRENKWRVVIPNVYNVGHEAHFAQVTEQFLEYLKTKKLPEWEVPNMITKYYITSKAMEFVSNGE